MKTYFALHLLLVSKVFAAKQIYHMMNYSLNLCYYLRHSPLKHLCPVDIILYLLNDKPCVKAADYLENIFWSEYPNLTPTIKTNK